MVLIAIFSQYLKNVKIPVCRVTRKDGCSMYKLPFFKLFPVGIFFMLFFCSFPICVFFHKIQPSLIDVFKCRIEMTVLLLLGFFLKILLALISAWVICGILTAAGAFPEQGKWGSDARTDTKIDVLEKALWFRFPYPGIFSYRNRLETIKLKKK